jgi:teichuronic acid biosynthesis glycosyltransferase TuaG
MLYFSYPVEFEVNFMAATVSVILPAYNCESTVGEAIRSVLSQSADDLELIIVDDCSADSTLDVIESFAAGDPRISVYTNPSNCGAARTRNTAISHAKGKYIAFIDSDDLWERNKLEIQLNIMESCKCDLCYTSYRFIDRKGNSVGNTYLVPARLTYKGLLKENVIGCTTVLLRSDILPAEPFNPGFFHEDYVLWLKLLRAGKTAIGVLDPLVRYRMGGRSANKLSAARHRWIIYRQAEKLPFLHAVFYMVSYSFRGATKSLFVKKSL